MLKILTSALVMSSLVALPVNAQPRPINLRCKLHAHSAEAWGGS